MISALSFNINHSFQSNQSFQTDSSLKNSRTNGQQTKSDFCLSMDNKIALTEGIVGIYGGSGQGKSTLLKICAQTIKSTNSKVIWHFGENEEVYFKPENSPAAYQEQKSELFDHLTVQQNLEFVLTHSLWQQPKIENGTNTINFDDVVDWCGISSLLTQTAISLSGGERQRVAFARSLLSGKPVVILDEPFSALDWTNRIQLLKRVKYIEQNHNIRFIIVSHSLRELAIVCEQMIEIENGKIVQHASTHEMLQRLSTSAPEPVFSRLQVKFEQQLSQYHLNKWALVGKETQFIYSKSLFEKACTISTNDRQTKPQSDIILIDADKVSLSHSELQQTSMLNQLYGEVVAITPLSHLMLITLDVNGQQLKSLISQLSFEKLQLEKGQNLFAYFKAI